MERSRAAAAAPEHDEVIDVTIASPRREGVKALSTSLNGMPGLRVVDDCISCPNGVPVCLASPPRVLLLDALLLDALGPRCLPAWRGAGRVKILLWCDEARTAWVERVVTEGFHGFLLTNDAPALVARAMRAVHRGELWLPRALLVDAIAHRLPPASPVGPTVAAGQAPLTPREAEVVAQLRQGASNKEIARQLGIMEDTVKKHLQSVFGKLGVHRRGLVMLQEPHP